MFLPLPDIDSVEDFSPFTSDPVTPRIWKFLSNAAGVAKHWNWRCLVPPQTALVDALGPGLWQRVPNYPVKL